MGGGIFGFKDEFRWMSNFWPVEIPHEGQTWPSVEHAYQASKTRDPEEKAQIRGASTAGKAKRLGREITIRPDWEEVRFDVMLSLQRLKYSDPSLACLLLATGDRYIEETNTWGDVFWGVCSGRGENKMGHILMQIRDELEEGRDML